MKTLNKFKHLIAVLTIASTTACGGGSTEAPTVEPIVIEPPAVTYTPMPGMAIDGYIVGATVWLDLNFNGQLDDGEPSDVTVEPTDDNPESFVIQVPGEHEDCSQYVPLMVHVPVGAIDLDDPENPIEEEFYLTSPPSFTMADDDELSNATPLTSIIWSSVKHELRADGNELTCESILANEGKRQEIKDRLLQQQWRIASRYNHSVDSLFTDYVANGNGELHQLARALVPGLAKSYEDTATLQVENPDMQYGYVEYYFETDADYRGNKWRRAEKVQSSPGNWDYSIQKMNQGLNNPGTEIERRQQRTTIANGIELTTGISFVDGQCSISEDYLEKGDQIGYGVQNFIYNPEATSWGQCVNSERATYVMSQSLRTKTFYSDNDTVKTESSHALEDESILVHLINVHPNDIQSGWLTSNINYISTVFEDTSDYGAQSWMRRHSYYASEDFANEDQVVSIHDSDDLYTVTTYRPDGTWTKRCGTWSSGDASLVDCTD